MLLKSKRNCNNHLNILQRRLPLSIPAYTVPSNKIKPQIPSEIAIQLPSGRQMYPALCKLYYSGAPTPCHRIASKLPYHRTPLIVIERMASIPPPMALVIIRRSIDPGRGVVLQASLRIVTIHGMIYRILALQPGPEAGVKVEHLVGMK